MKTSTRPGRNNIVAAILWTFLFAGHLWAGTTYYVDFDSGSNTNAGTQAAPWKHAPGDPNATNGPKNVALQPGDTVLFKGGVTYRGSINITAQGTEANPITYKGDGWGTSKAIIDGSDPFNATWTRCTSAADCGGNPNWANIWYTTAPANFNIFCPVYEDGEFLWFAQDPNPANPIFYDRYQEFRDIPLNDPNTTITQTTLKDSRYFTQSDTSYWNNSYIMIWHNPNTVTPVPITNFNAQTNTLSFNDIGDVLYKNKPGKYAMLGHVSLIDIPGEFSQHNNNLFAWPKNSDNPNNHIYSISSRKVGIEINGGCHYLVVEGFLIRDFHGLIKEHAQGCGVRSSSTILSTNITIRNNEFTQLRSLEKKGAIYMSTGSNFRIENNYIHHCQKNNGILASGDRIYCDRNTIEYIGYIGIIYMRATNSRIIDNLIRYTNATHANGVSVYTSSKNVLISRNRIIIGAENIPLTIEMSENIYIIGNLLDGMVDSRGFANWGGMTGVNPILNNTIVRGNKNIGAYVASTASSFVFRNNIISGLLGSTVSTLPTNRQYNLYTTYSWQQNNAAWSLNTGEIYNPATSSIFVDHDKGDFHLKADSPAIGKGIDVSSYYPTDLFPDVDFSVDLEGKVRSVGWHLGAYTPTNRDTDAPEAPIGLSGHLVP